VEFRLFRGLFKFFLDFSAFDFQSYFVQLIALARSRRKLNELTPISPVNGRNFQKCGSKKKVGRRPLFYFPFVIFPNAL
jgi:hypothetical protein